MRRFHFQLSTLSPLVLAKHHQSRLLIKLAEFLAYGVTGDNNCLFTLLHACFVCIEHAHLMCMKRASISLKLKLQIFVSHLVLVGNQVEIL